VLQLREAVARTRFPLRQDRPVIRGRDLPLRRSLWALTTPVVSITCDRAPGALDTWQPGRGPAGEATLRRLSLSRSPLSDQGYDIGSADLPVHVAVEIPQELRTVRCALESRRGEHFPNPASPPKSGDFFRPNLRLLRLHALTLTTGCDCATAQDIAAPHSYLSCWRERTGLPPERPPMHVQTPAALPELADSAASVISAARHADPAVRIAAAYHPALPRELRTLLTTGASDEVRTAAGNALLSTAEELTASYVFALAFVPR